MQDNSSRNQNLPRTDTNQYGKPAPEYCHRCGKHAHRSNVCPECRVVNLLEAIVNGGGVAEDDDDADYEEAKYAHADREQVNCIIHNILYAALQPSQQNSIFHSYCSINKKVYDVIGDNKSCKNFVARRMVEHLHLLVEKHLAPYMIGWIQKGSMVNVTEICHVPLSIGRSYSTEVLYVVVDMNESQSYWADHGSLT